MLKAVFMLARVAFMASRDHSRRWRMGEARRQGSCDI